MANSVVHQMFSFARMIVRPVAVVFAIGVCSTSFGQRYYPNTMMRSYINQANKMNAEQKKASIAQANDLIRKSDAKLKECSTQVSRLKSELESAKDDIKNCEKSVGENEAAMVEARKHRSNLETKLLDSQSEKSPYRVASKLMHDAEIESIKHAERVLQRPVKDGNPDRLRSTLKRQEYKSLEGDSEWVATFRRFRAAKEQQTTEIKSLVSKDAAISTLDESIVQLVENRKKLKADLSAAKSKKGKLNASIQQLTEEQEVVTQDRDAAQSFLAMVNGK